MTNLRKWQTKTFPVDIRIFTQLHVYERAHFLKNKNLPERKEIFASVNYLENKTVSSNLEAQ